MLSQLRHACNLLPLILCCTNAHVQATRRLVILISSSRVWKAVCKEASCTMHSLRVTNRLPNLLCSSLVNAISQNNVSTYWKRLPICYKGAQLSGRCRELHSGQHHQIPLPLYVPKPNTQTQHMENDGEWPGSDHFRMIIASWSGNKSLNVFYSLFFFGGATPGTEISKGQPMKEPNHIYCLSLSLSLGSHVILWCRKCQSLCQGSIASCEAFRSTLNTGMDTLAWKRNLKGFSFSKFY